MPAHAECDRTLRDLEVLRHIGIHIVLAVEHRALLDVAIRGQARNTIDSIAALLGTGSAPGSPRQTGQVCVLGAAPNSSLQPQNILVSSVVNSA